MHASSRNTYIGPATFVRATTKGHAMEPMGALLQRRAMVQTAAGLGALAAIGNNLGTPRDPAPAAHKAGSESGPALRYRLTPHIRSYYRTTLV